MVPYNGPDSVKIIAMWRVAVLCFNLIALAACGGGGSQSRPAPPGPSPPPPPPSVCNDALEFCGTIPGNADPCADEQYWPLSVASSVRPLMVHFPRQDNETKAFEMIALLEESWAVQVDTLGFTAPLSDDGACGPDGNFDIFIWPGIGGAFVSSVASIPATPHEDSSTYMAFDPTGINGGAWLNSFMAHELNHALQASDDWTEDAQHYEAGATFAETVVYPDDEDWFFEMEDFQDTPEWSLFFDDFGATWYTYAAAMYLHYLYERFYPGDPGFYARIWRGTRSNVGESRPDYIDAVRQVLLIERGVTLDETIVEFSQWRWFVDQFDDGAHFARGAAWPHTVDVDDIDASAIPATHSLSAMVYGANYVRISNGSAGPVSFNVATDSSDVDVAWRLLDVAGGDVVGPITVMPNDEVVLVAIVRNLLIERQVSGPDLNNRQDDSEPAICGRAIRDADSETTTQ